MYKLVILLIIILILSFYISNLYVKNFINTNTNKIQIPIYVSLTSIYKNQNELYLTLKSILSQTQKPDKIFVYLSEEPYILDDGFKNKKITDKNLIKLVNNNNIIEVKWVENTGPYRKLLPLLKSKWDEDCIIITIDDDSIYDKNLIKNLINDYNTYKCVINYNGFTPNMSRLEQFNIDIRSKFIPLSRFNYPYGNSGILYKPEFFKKTGDLIFDKNIYQKTCNKQDDIWFYIVRMLNNVNCYINIKQKWNKKYIITEGLWFHFNKKEQTNNNAYHKTLIAIKKKYDYKL
jgi:hypothetical protein